MIKTLFFIIWGLFTQSAFAEKIPFKQATAPEQGWFIYVITFIALLVIALVLAWKKRHPLAQSSCLIVDRKRLANKTMIYVIEYQNQRFLIADNQQSLILQPVSNEGSVG
ncbi:hypothetical protein [Legionella fairfieldensis]|uniref:hypothetical protein n=1 Tax=Legionella fairfieldensis TaxID=45064 RepID=UPI00048C5CF7|nr:hypothetical protein [Legionella fairfieldensis]